MSEASRLWQTYLGIFRTPILSTFVLALVLSQGSISKPILDHSTNNTLLHITVSF